MLSRRSVRIKVMQTLYAFRTLPDSSFKDVEKHYLLSINKTFSLYLYCLLYMKNTLQYFKIDSEKKENRKLKSEKDDVSLKFYETPEAQSFVNSDTIDQLCKEYDVNTEIDIDLIRNFYKEFIKSVAYLKFEGGSGTAEEAVSHLFKLLIKNDVSSEMITDRYPNWFDDESIVKGAVKKTLRAIPLESDFHKAYLPEKEKTLDLGVNLLYRTWSNNEELEGLIHPRLNNWDPKRVARIDMILLKMCTSEFLNFETIPVSASINEYIEISKLYSTPKSKEFINGVLDGVVEALKIENKINSKKL